MIKLILVFLLIIGIAFANKQLGLNVPQVEKIEDGDSVHFVDSDGNMVSLQPNEDNSGRKVIFADKNSNVFSFESKKLDGLKILSMVKNGGLEVTKFDSDGDGLPEKMLKEQDGGEIIEYEIKYQFIEIKKHDNIK